MLILETFHKAIIMEVLMIQSREHFTQAVVNKTKKEIRNRSATKTQKVVAGATTNSSFNKLNNSRIIGPNTTTYYEMEVKMWNDSTNSTTSTVFLNVTADLPTDLVLEYDYRTINSSVFPTIEESWQCKEWTPAQHNLFQTANFFFAAAFLVPSSFKQSILLVRALLAIGYIFTTCWAGLEVCALDILLWNTLLVLLNFIHTCLLTWKFLPPTLTLDLTELYLKMFKPLKISKKHFKELVREARVMTIEKGDIYAVEDASPADERLSILLKGRLRVTCNDTHLHYINVHQFIDSPEWEANHEQSDDVFQVTITAEEDSVYLCWPRMKLERFLRHRPLIKTVLDCIIGKDITQKLYSLNEHLSGLSAEMKRGKDKKLWASAHSRSMSVDAVNTGITGLVRSTSYKCEQQRQQSFTSTETISFGKSIPGWIPFVANQFPTNSPFINQCSANDDSAASLLRQDSTQTPPQRSRSLRRTREVKFRN